MLTGEVHVAVHLTGTVDAHPIEAVDHLEFDPAGRVRTMTVLARPLAAVVALQNRLAPTLGRRPGPGTGGRRGAGASA